MKEKGDRRSRSRRSSPPGWENPVPCLKKPGEQGSLSRAPSSERVKFEAQECSEVSANENASGHGTLNGSGNSGLVSEEDSGLDSGKGSGSRSRSSEGSIRSVGSVGGLVPRAQAEEPGGQGRAEVPGLAAVVTALGQVPIAGTVTVCRKCGAALLVGLVFCCKC